MRGGSKFFIQKVIYARADELKNGSESYIHPDSIPEDFTYKDIATVEFRLGLLRHFKQVF